ncbi:MAG: endonuclease III domain-containing protein [Chloroflexota bacterium]
MSSRHARPAPRPAGTAHREPDTWEAREVFDRLLREYGERNWWPADGPFEVVVGAILTQNAAWTNVEKALSNLRQAGVWSVRSVYHAEQDRLAHLVRPSGYFNQKARKLKEFARVVMFEHGGDLQDMLALPMDTLRERLLAIWGIGEETADDIVLYAAGQPSFVIDAFTRRIVDRLGWKVAGNRYPDYQRLFTERLPVDVQLYNEYHALLDKHAQKTCAPRPACERCCLLDICVTGQSNTGEGA